MRTIFPKTVFAESKSSAEQLRQVYAEFAEVVEAERLPIQLLDVNGRLVNVDLYRELADLQHSIETFWHQIEREHGAGFVEREILRWVEEKNRARGYYLEVPK